MTMTKALLQQLAEAGVRERVAALERELAEYHKVWPKVFISATAPQLLKAMPKGSTNGHWPATTFTKTKDTPSTDHKARTPANRAAASRRMKARWKKGVFKSSLSSRGKRLAKVHAYLKKHGESSTQDLMAAAGYPKSAGLITAMNIGLRSGIFKRTGRGRYALGSKA